MVVLLGPDLVGTQGKKSKQPAIYFNLLRDCCSRDELMWLHQCSVSLQWWRFTGFCAFEGWLLFSSHYTASEMYPGGWVRGIEVCFFGVVVSGWNKEPSVLQKHLFCWSRTCGASLGLSLLSTVKNEAFLNPQHSLCFPLGASDTLS